MFFSQMQPLNILSDHVKEQDLSEDASPFHGLLLSEQTETTKEKSNPKENTDEAVVDMDELLYRMLIGNEKIEEDENETLEDQKSTRQNSSHVAISYAVICLKKK